MRHTDQAEKRYFRSPERVFHMNGAWFFAAREGDQGPYKSPREAECEVARFVVEQTELRGFQRQREHPELRVAKLELEPLEFEADAYTLPRRAVI